MTSPVAQAVREATGETAGGIGVARDVRRLIAQVERGTPFDREWTGHAFDVLADARAELQSRLGGDDNAGLSAELARRIDAFARSSATTGLYLRLVIDDRLPDLPDYNPCALSVFDGIDERGSDFSRVIQRATIYGTVMTSVNITDLRAYFESGRRRRLLLYLGTDRDADIRALDRMLAALPGIVAAAGLDPALGQEIAKALREGGLSPLVLKTLSHIVRLADIARLPVAAPERAALLAETLRELGALVPQLAAFAGVNAPGLNVPGIETVVARLAAALVAMPLARLSAVLAAATRADNDNAAATRADNDNATPGHVPGPAEILRDLRALARDRTLPRELRAAIAVILREMRTQLRGTGGMGGTGQIAPALTLMAGQTLRLAATHALPPGPLRTALQVRLGAEIRESMPALPTPLRVSVFTRMLTVVPPVSPPAPAILGDLRQLAREQPRILPTMSRPALAEAIMDLRRAIRMPETGARGANAGSGDDLPRVRAQARALALISAQIGTQIAAQIVAPPHGQAAPAPALPVHGTRTPVTTDISAKTVLVHPPAAPAPAPAPTIAAPTVAIPSVATPRAALVPSEIKASSAPPESAFRESAPAGPVQYNADGTVRACCLNKFNAAGSGSGDANAPAVVNPDGGIVFRNTDGAAIAAYSAQSVENNAAAHDRITQALAERRARESIAPDVARQVAWNKDLIAHLQDRTAIGKTVIVPEFTQAVEQDGTSAPQVMRDIDVKLVAVEQQGNARGADRLRRRSIHPA